MASTNIDDAALEELRKLASWVSQSAKMEADKVKRNVMVCVDKSREANVRPLLEKLGYANIPVRAVF
jgi:ABC-type transport system involved in cytochrome bd biosynthesis fused ATPase/permease subunit